MHGESIHGTCKCFSWFSFEGPSVARGTTYGIVDGPGGPSMAAILGLGNHPQQQKLAVDGPGDRYWGDHPWHDRAHVQTPK